MNYEQVQEAVRAYKGVDLVRESSPEAGMFDLRHHSRQGRCLVWKMEDVNGRYRGTGARKEVVYYSNTAKFVAFGVE